MIVSNEFNAVEVCALWTAAVVTEWLQRHDSRFIVTNLAITTMTMVMVLWHHSHENLAKLVLDTIKHHGIFRDGKISWKSY